MDSDHHNNYKTGKPYSNDEYQSKKTNSSQYGEQTTGHKHQANPTQLLSSAKLVAEAAKSTMRHDMNKVDKAKVAGAAADLIGAASHYAKLEEKSFGKYVEKAENYLHQYHTSHGSVVGDVDAHVNPTAGVVHATGQHHSGSSGGVSAEHGHSSSSSTEGGFGDYLKLAEGFLKKH